METRANFILIGLFTILGILGSLAFFVWLASVQVDRQYTQYGVLFSNVSGLDRSGEVLFNGINVGRVNDIRIWEQDPSKVFVSIEIDAGTPVRTDTSAQLKSSGVTGVAYIELTGGSANAPTLTGEAGALPIIPSQRSTVQTIVEDAPDLLEDASELMAQLQALTGPENQELVNEILKNFEASSARLDTALTDFSEISQTVREATAQITVFTDRLDAISASVQTTLETTNTTLEAATGAFNEAEIVLEGTTEAIDSARSAFAAVEDIAVNDAPAIVDQISSALETIETTTRSALSGFGETSELANQRLIELEQTLSSADTAFAAVSDASDTLDRFLNEDATVLASDASEALASVQTSLNSLQGVIEEDVPVIMTDVREAVSAANATMDQISQDLTAASAQLDPFVTQAQETLATVNETFERSRTTLDGLDSTLAAAESAFAGADRVMAESLDPVLTDIRDSAARVSDAVAEIADNAPEVTEDLLDLIARADATVASIQGVVARSGPDFQNFANNALPQITRLTQEARTLVTSLNSLSRRVEQDPTGLILDNRVPDYRR